MSEFYNFLVLPLLIVISFFGIVYFIGCIYDFFRKKNRQRTEKIRSQLILLSNSTLDIENYLISNEKYLTPDVVEQLIARFAELKADEKIEQDWQTRFRVEEPVVEEAIFDNDKIKPLKQIKKKRTRNTRHIK